MRSHIETAADEEHFLSVLRGNLQRTDNDLRRSFNATVFAILALVFVVRGVVSASELELPMLGLKLDLWNGAVVLLYAAYFSYMSFLHNAFEYAKLYSTLLSYYITWSQERASLRFFWLKRDSVNIKTLLVVSQLLITTSAITVLANTFVRSIYSIAELEESEFRNAMRMLKIKAVSVIILILILPLGVLCTLNVAVSSHFYRDPTSYLALMFAYGALAAASAYYAIRCMDDYSSFLTSLVPSKDLLAEAAIDSGEIPSSHLESEAGPTTDQIGPT